MDDEPGQVQRAVGWQPMLSTRMWCFQSVERGVVRDNHMAYQKKSITSARKRIARVPLARIEKTPSESDR